jgi:hypothetical protein
MLGSTLGSTIVARQSEVRRWDHLLPFEPHDPGPRRLQPQGEDSAQEAAVDSGPEGASEDAAAGEGALSAGFDDRRKRLTQSDPGREMRVEQPLLPLPRLPVALGSHGTSTRGPGLR